MAQTVTKNIFELEGPEGNAIVGSLAELGADPLGFLTYCDRSYGDIIPFRLGLTPTCLVTHPALITQVLRERDIFIKSRGFRALSTLLGKGLLTNEGDSWFRQRRLAQPAFHQSRITGYSNIMVNYTQQMLTAWRTGETRDIHADMMQLTLSIVMKAIFSQDISTDQAKTVAHTLNVAMNWFENKRRQNFLLWEWIPLPENLRYRSAVGAMDSTIYAIIHERRETGENPGDLLSMLMDARDEDDGTCMSDQQLRDEIATLMLAGHETTANTLSWTWMLLAQNPEASAKLHAELNQVLAGRLPNTTDIPNLPYTSAVIKESMRLYPPVSLLGRENAEDTEIGNYFLPKGCLILLSQWVMHRSLTYFEAPETFLPERWLGDLEKQLPRGVYFPFGDGPRVCIGKGFALMEAVLILATIAQQYVLSLVPNQKITPQPSITLRPEHGIKVTLESRSQ